MRAVTQEEILFSFDFQAATFGVAKKKIENQQFASSAILIFMAPMVLMVVSIPRNNLLKKLSLCGLVEMTT